MINVGQIRINEKTGKSSVTRTVRAELKLVERAAMLAQRRGESLNAILAAAIVAGLPMVEAEAVSDER